MSGPRERDPARLFAGFALRATGVAALVGLASWYFGSRWLADVGDLGAATRAAMAGCAVSWIASLVGGLLLVAGPPDPQTAAVRALGATGLRLVAVVVLVMAASLGLGLPVKPLLLWTAISYVALLAVDTQFALTAAAGGASKPAQREADDEGGETEDRESGRGN